MNCNRLKQDGLKLKAGGYRMKDMIRFVVKQQIVPGKVVRILGRRINLETIQ